MEHLYMPDHSQLTTMRNSMWQQKAAQFTRLNQAIVTVMTVLRDVITVL